MNSEQITDQPDRELVNQLSNAGYASLTSRAVTGTANGIVDRLIEFLEGREEYRKSRKNKRSAKARYDLRRAMEGFVGDLLRAYRDDKSGGWVYRSLKASSFSGEAVSYRQFLLVLESLGDFVERIGGYQQWSEFDPGARVPIRGKTTRFRATSLLIEYCAVHGLDAAEIGNHFIQDLPQRPLVKRSGSVRDPYGSKVRGKTMKFERTAKALELERQVSDLNDFLDGFNLRGGSHRGYVRIFNQGDHPSFDWNKGGRLYSHGNDSYQRLKSDDRLRMTIDGEAVCEIDIRASYLTIYLAHHGAPLEPECDPYELPGLPTEARGVIKKWFVATFGNTGHLERWPREIAADYWKEQGHKIGKRYPLKNIRAKALQQFPLLERWGTDGLDWADLMFVESQAMIGAMEQLKQSGIPSVTVHDSLIVPASKREIAERALCTHYLEKTGVIPVLRTKTLESELAVRLPSVVSEVSRTADRKDDLLPIRAFDGEHHSTLKDDDPYGFGENEEVEAAIEDDTEDDWEWPAGREPDEEEDGKPPRRNIKSGDDGEEYDPSLYV